MMKMVMTVVNKKVLIRVYSREAVERYEVNAWKARFVVPIE